MSSLSQSDLALGLGCSRLGSVNGATGTEARDLLQAALDQGVRFFDTSNIYAQGDSERYSGIRYRNARGLHYLHQGGQIPVLQTSDAGASERAYSVADPQASFGTAERVKGARAAHADPLGWPFFCCVA